MRHFFDLKWIRIVTIGIVVVVVVASLLSSSHHFFLGQNMLTTDRRRVGTREAYKLKMPIWEIASQVRNAVTFEVASHGQENDNLGGFFAWSKRRIRSKVIADHLGAFVA